MYDMYLPNRVVHSSPVLYCQFHVIAVCLAAWHFCQELTLIRLETVTDKMIIHDVSDNYSWEDKSFHN